MDLDLDRALVQRYIEAARGAVFSSTARLPEVPLPQH